MTAVHDNTQYIPTEILKYAEQTIVPETTFTMDRALGDWVKNQLMLRLEMNVLSSEAGETVSDTRVIPYPTHSITEPNFPKWLPSFLKRRWVKEKEIGGGSTTVTLSCKPVWTYPELSGLGSAVAKIKH